MDKVNKSFSRIAFFSTVLAFIVVMLGAYTRLKDAGLGCPDWPLCYGRILAPNNPTEIHAVASQYPNSVIQPTKAWAEMVHRYFAGTLVILIILLTVWSTKERKNSRIFPYLQNGSYKPFKIPLVLVGCILFQAMLGMWTVTWQLLPLVVMGHLLGGMTIVTLLWWLTLVVGQWANPVESGAFFLKPFVVGGVGIVLIQIFLGGWTSANYASIVCPDFPFCQGSLFPKLNFLEAFNFLSPIGKNYQGGVLGLSARVTIQMVHRYWAFVTFCYLSILNFYILFSSRTDALKNTAGMVLLILGCQIFLGILNIATSLSLPIAISHNAVALLLLLSIVTLLYQLNAGQALKPKNEMCS